MKPAGSDSDDPSSLKVVLMKHITSFYVSRVSFCFSTSASLHSSLPPASSFTHWLGTIVSRFLILFERSSGGVHSIGRVWECSWTSCREGTARILHDEAECD